MTDQVFPDDDALQRLISALGDEVLALADALIAGDINVDEWREAMGKLLARYHTAAWLQGAGEALLNEAERQLLELYVGTQLAYLDNFVDDIIAAGEFRHGWRSRAKMYANAIKASYWAGMAEALPLPAMPGDGTTQCVNNCRCRWEIVTIDEEAGDYDCFWMLSPVEHCQTCLVRAQEWNPLRIRAFEVQAFAVDTTFSGDPLVDVHFGSQKEFGRRFKHLPGQHSQGTHAGSSAGDAQDWQGRPIKPGRELRGGNLTKGERDIIHAARRSPTSSFLVEDVDRAALDTMLAGGFARLLKKPMKTAKQAAELTLAGHEINRQLWFVEQRIGVAHKHLAGRHDQKKHGWRYGSVEGMRRALAGRDIVDRDQYRQGAARRGFTVPQTGELNKLSTKPVPVVKPKPKKVPKPKPVKKSYHQYDPNDATAAHTDFHGDSGWQSWLNGLNRAEVWAIKQYVGSPGNHGVYETLNPLLRRGAFDPDAYPGSGITGVYRGMRSVIEKGSLHRDMMLYRGMDFQKMYDGLSSGKYQKGDLVPDDAFVSTAPKMGTATGWYFMRGRYPVLWRIKAPKGAKAAYLSWDERLSNPYMHETEVVLPPGSNFKIENASFMSINGKTTAVFDMVLEVEE